MKHCLRAPVLAFLVLACLVSIPRAEPSGDFDQLKSIFIEFIQRDGSRCDNPYVDAGRLFCDVRREVPGVSPDLLSRVPPERLQAAARQAFLIVQGEFNQEFGKNQICRRDPHACVQAHRLGLVHLPSADYHFDSDLRKP